MSEPQAPIGNADHSDPDNPIAIPSWELLNYLSLRAAQIVDDRARQREERRAKNLTLILAVLSVVGIGAAVALVNNAIHSEIASKFQNVQGATDTKNAALNREVSEKLGQFKAELNLFQEELHLRLDSSEQRLTSALSSEGKQIADLRPELDRKIEVGSTRAVGSQVAALNDSLHTEVNYQSLARIALGLDVKRNYSPAERDEVVSLLRQLKGTPVIARPEFTAILERIVNRFHLSRQKEAMDEIDSLLGDVVSQNNAMTRIMIEDYGLRVIGSHNTLAEEAPVVARFQRYLGKASSVGSPELEFLWDMMLEAKGADRGDLRPNPRLAEAIQYLAPEDARFLVIKLIAFSVPASWSHIRSFESEQLAHYAKAVRKSYASPLKRIVASLGPEKFAAGLAEFVEQMSSDKTLDEKTQQEILAIAKELIGETDELKEEPKKTSGRH
jgi:hypothetical protein